MSDNSNQTANDEVEEFKRRLDAIHERIAGLQLLCAEREWAEAAQQAMIRAQEGMCN
jgi:hypothetical protein